MAWQRRGFEPHWLHSGGAGRGGEQVGAHQFRNHFGWYMERAAAGEEILGTAAASRACACPGACPAADRRLEARGGATPDRRQPTATAASASFRSKKTSHFTNTPSRIVKS